jgi:hypothetical protein
METITMGIRTSCTRCGTDTERRIAGELVCVDCEMRDLAGHCARRPELRPVDVLEAYLGRPATEEEAEAFTRHFLEAAEARPE